MKMILEPQEGINSANYSKRSCKIRRVDKDDSEAVTEIWFQLESSIPPPPDDDCDAYLLASLMDAMQEGRSLHIKGYVSLQLLGNLIEYQAAWNKWRPEKYQCVEITADQIRDSSDRVAGAISAFSGGVDATFSVWRHTQSKNSYRSQKINLCSIVHGFDIPLSDNQAFENASNRARETLNDIGLELAPIKTNYREVSRVNWEDAFSMALVAALNNFKKVAGTCVIGSSEPYDSLVIPWGSSPITDHLLSSGDFVVLHDGASHSRTEKVKEIAEWEIGRSNLRVCWQGDLKDRNCGVCEKCVRTKLNFLAVNKHVPSCFPDSNILHDIGKVRLGNDAVRAEWKQIYDYAKNQSANGAWIDLVRKASSRKSKLDILLPRNSTRRKFVKEIVMQVRQLRTRAGI